MGVDMEKKFLAVSIATLAVVFGLTQWYSNRASADTAPSCAPSSASQIVIHGTPVCVFSLGDGIVAKVGRCPDSAETDNGAGDAPDGNAGTFGTPEQELPPGHPPAGAGNIPDGARSIPI